MASAGTSHSSETVTETIEKEEQDQLVLNLKLHKPKQDKKVKWTTETVDNEHLNKKKSKCCCIYEKPRMFGESSSEDEDDDCTDHCKGHKKKCYQNQSHDHAHGEGSSGGGGAGGADGAIAS